MKKIYQLTTILIILLSLQVTAQINARLMRYPDVSKDKITFVYAGDVWLVARSGGQAIKLSSPDGQEVLPKFSPDGKHVVYTANYDGNADIYKVSVDGGTPERLTFHSWTDRVIDWHPDGDQILFASSRESGRQRFSQLYLIDQNGGLPEKLPLAYGEFASFAEDGNLLAFTKRTRLFRTWKRYRGGTAADIFIFDMKNNSAVNITDNPANDEMPMFSGDKVYYLSDRGENLRYNIWVYDTKAKSHTQLTKFKDYDVHFPSIGPDALVYEAGGDLYLMNLADNSSKKVNVEIVDDQYLARPKYVDAKDYLENYNISPDGNRVIAECRGEILSFPKKDGVIKNLTQSSGSAERYPAWSPDAKKIAYWSDRTGEYELTVYDYATGEEKTLTSTGKGFKYNIYWSPDSEHLVFINQAMEIWLYSFGGNDLTKIDQALWLMEGGLRNFSASWSSDSKWVVYSRGLDNNNNAVFLYDVTAGKTHQVTSGYYNDMNPVFDPDGKYIYLVTNREFTPVYGDMDNSFIYPNATKLAAIALRMDVASPLAPENDTVEIKEEKKEEEKDSDKKDDKKEKEEESLKIDLEGFESRLVALPVDPGNIGGLSAVSGKVIYVRTPNSGSGERGSDIKYYDLEERESSTIMSGTGSYALSADGKKMAVYKSGGIAVVDVKAKQDMKDQIPLASAKIHVSPKEEWDQILTEVWRLERDMFYDPNMHGVDWDRMRDNYKAILKDASSRYDVDFLIGELIGELNASHTYKGGGDTERPDRMNVGYLGINWAVENGKYKIAEIIKGAAWDDEVRSPFDQPGIDVEVGDFILSVNGLEMDAANEPFMYFQNLGGKTVEMMIGKTANIDDAKKVVVETLSSESRLRHLNWIEKNRKFVDDKTDGKVGYIYVRSTGRDGQNELVRQFRAQFHKDALIIDERFNSGGQIPDRFIELLNRAPLAYWAVRDGKTWQWPPQANFGPKVMLINGWSGSGGDAFPDYFRKSGLGKLVGTRTWGGLIGISGAPSLIDGGAVTVPTFRMYNPEGGWFKEGYGVDPDIPVEDDPAEMAKGKDPQLQKAVDVILEELKTGFKKPNQPEYEKR
ncbi:MAG: tricorn protease [Melioribacteraceae bacterium]|nr:MAG: tricorn protease [Melioribacteraceae bacterium]